MRVKTRTKISMYVLCLSSLVFIYGLKMIYLISQSSIIMKILDYIEWPFYVILIGTIFWGKDYSRKKLYALAVLGSVLLFVYYYTGYAILFKAFVLIVSAKDISYDRIVKNICRTYCIILTLSLFLFFFGFSNAGLQRRGYWAYGFVTSNICGQIIFIIGLLLWLDENINLFKRVIIVVVLSGVVYFSVNNRSVAILLLFVPPAEILMNKLNHENKYKIIKFLIYCIPALAILISVTTALLYPVSKFIQKLNIILTSRIYLNFLNMQQHGVHFFAKNVYFDNTRIIYNAVADTYSSFNTIDSSYMCLLIQMGIVSTGIYIVVYIFLCKRLFEEKYSRLLSIVVILGVYGLFESSALEIYINVPFIYLLAKGDEDRQVQMINEQRRYRS